MTTSLNRIREDPIRKGGGKGKETEPEPEPEIENCKEIKKKKKKKKKKKCEKQHPKSGQLGERRLSAMHLTRHWPVWKD